MHDVKNLTKVHGAHEQWFVIFHGRNKQGFHLLESRFFLQKNHQGMGV
jgi:hypothetical protein